MTDDTYTIEIEGQRYGPGSALEILRAMKESPWEADPPENGEYFDWLVGQAERLTGTALRADGETTEERARCLLESMIAAGLARRVAS
jgi:hypothetical protein